MPAGPEPVHESRRTPGRAPGRRWFEGHRLEIFSAADAVFGLASVSSSVVAEPSAGQVSFTAVLLREGRRPLVVAEDDIALPSRGWELRASGLWADHICETPLDHWSYGLEAFGLELDNPAELLDRAVGDRAPIGWELEFESDARAAWQGGHDGSDQASGANHVLDHEYRQTGIGHGLLLDADGEHEFEGVAVRSHWWGSQPPQRSLVGAAPTDWPIPLSWVVVPSREAVWRYALWGAGASSSSIDS